jgi:hypothetical protein
MKPDKRFFVACLHLLQGEQITVPRVLQRLFRLEPFRTKRGRMGKITLVGAKEVSYYTSESWAIRSIPW